MPLIENAFKYASNHTDRENRICIKLFTKAHVLHCTLFNTKETQPALVATNANGIGITNLKRRLELLYPGNYTLTSITADESYETSLIVDLT